MLCHLCVYIYVVVYCAEVLLTMVHTPVHVEIQRKNHRPMNMKRNEPYGRCMEPRSYFVIVTQGLLCFFLSGVIRAEQAKHPECYFNFEHLERSLNNKKKRGVIKIHCKPPAV